jgi:hypothetical protein
MELRVNEIIEYTLAGAEVLTERIDRGRVTGNVVWAGFDGQDDTDRQQVLRDLLSRELGPDIRDVGILFTYTPNEMEIMSAA